MIEEYEAMHKKIRMNVLVLPRTELPNSSEELYKYKIFGDDDKIITKEIEWDVLRVVTNAYTNIISISLYEEDNESLLDTLSGIYENKITDNEEKTYLMSQTLIIIISDGYKKLNSHLEEQLTKWKLYDKNKVKEFIKSQNQKIDEDMSFAFEGKLRYKSPITGRPNRDDLPDNNTIDIIFMTKIKNMKKLHSHLWLYKYFCKELDPQFIIVISK